MSATAPADDTTYVCDGVDGSDGLTSLITTTVEAAGGNCADGGQRVDSGLDNGDGGGTAGNGTLEAGEIDDTAYVCDGPQGDQQVISAAAEPPGANCPTGGQRVDTGLDNGDGGGTADNGTLEAGEIDDTWYVCNGCLTTAAPGNIAFTPTTIGATGNLQTWTVPVGVCQITVTASGAEGGNGSSQGATIEGTFPVSPGQDLTILVGQLGDMGTSHTAGFAGGGGTYVVDADDNPLVIAGGGGSCFSVCPAASETVGQAGEAGGTAGATPRATGGAGGNVGNTTSGGGGGFVGDGANAQGGLAYLNGATGGSANAIGGFGGGGARSGSFGQGGGGGYSGGSCGDLSNAWFGCGGGGSLNNGGNQTNTAGANAGGGSVNISW
jgi:hypothetical protein